MFKKRSAWYFFVYYHIVSIALSMYAIVSPDVGVAFDYDDYFSLSTFLPYVMLIAAMLGVFFIGYSIPRVVVGDGKDEPLLSQNSMFKFNAQIGRTALYLQNFVVLYYAIICLVFFRSGAAPSDVDGRILGGKEQYLFLLIQGILPIAAWDRKWIRNYSIVCCFVLGFLFSWIDASRSGVIPLAGLLFAAIAARKNFLFGFTLVSAIVFYVISVSARVFPDRLSYDFIATYTQYLGENFFDIVYGAISYLTAFSIMHFAYVVDNHSGSFGFYDFVYSVVPVPTMFWSTEFDIDSWRVDQFRPMGAIAEIYRVTPIFALIHFFLMGLIAKKVDLLEKHGFKILTLTLFILTTIGMYQYSMRTIQWYVYLIVFILFVDKARIARLKRRAPLHHA